MRRARSAIAIGASAGGVEALTAILPALPADLPAAVLVVVHVPRDRPSLLAEVFAARCKLAVREATDKEPAESGTIYFAPPDYHLLVEDGGDLALSVDEPVNYSRPSIDVLFESAALAWRDRLVGVVLTGGNDDGSRGLLAIAQNGGTTVVQDPSTAKVPQMPDAALARLKPDHVVPVEAMPELLARLAGAVAA